MNYKGVLLIVFGLLQSIVIIAQEEPRSSAIDLNDYVLKLQSRQPGQGVVTIQQDTRLHDLLNAHRLYSQRHPGINGYRIRIFSELGTHAREEWDMAKARFYSRFPDIPIYQEYKNPSYKIYVGDYRTKIDALKALEKIQMYYPNAFIVPDRINRPEKPEKSTQE
ncbi:MAG: SPOR domain-containing protein [Bacteroidales bacterium]|jgi:hypothetical protein